MFETLAERVYIVDVDQDQKKASKELVLGLSISEKE